jgi:hypothetical protein
MKKIVTQNMWILVLAALGLSCYLYYKKYKEENPTTTTT